MAQRSRSQEGGFTLIELLTVIGIIGVLVSLSISGLAVYRAGAAYAVATNTLRNARNALEASVTDQNNLPAAVGLTVISEQGGVSGAAGPVMVGMQIPKNITLRVAYNPACVDSSCQEVMLSSKHCYGKEYIQWQRFGDGVEVILENIAGAGCT